MNASTVSRQINNMRPSLKGKYSVRKNANGSINVIVSDMKIQLEIENALANCGYMFTDSANGFEVC